MDRNEANVVLKSFTRQQMECVGAVLRQFASNPENETLKATARQGLIAAAIAFETARPLP